MKSNIQLNLKSKEKKLANFDLQKRSNSHNVITEYNIFVTPRVSNANPLESKLKTPMLNLNKKSSFSPNNSGNFQQPLQNLEYLLSKKPSTKNFKFPIKEILKNYNSVYSKEKKGIFDPKNESHDDDNLKLLCSLSHRDLENRNGEIMKLVSDQIKQSDLPNNQKTYMAMNNTSKIKKMLMISPYNNSKKGVVNSLKSLKNLSHGNLIIEDNKSNNNSASNLTKSTIGFLNNLNISRKNLSKLSPSGKVPLSKGVVEKNERNSSKNKENKQIILEESNAKNSISYKSTNNTSSKSAEKIKDRQSEDLFILFNRAKSLLNKYKIKEVEWKKEREDLIKEINFLRGNQENEKRNF